jgi:tRNA pseudouridine38-40 synthase
MNFKITVSYDGFEFNGSQTQPDKSSVEDRILEAFKRLNVDVKIILSGRTDKGVHATGQVFNVHLPEHFHQTQQLKKLLNHHLPLSIRVLNIKPVPLDFHARFSAKKRVYRYVITQNELTPFISRYITHVQTVNVEKIQEAIVEFIGEHDFEYFQKKGAINSIFIKKCMKQSFMPTKSFIFLNSKPIRIYVLKYD